jgi:hypothetical protein
MKKIVSTFAFALLVGGLTFAEDAAVKIGAWGRGLFIPVITGGQIAGEDATASVLGVSWGGVPRVGFTVSGTSDAVGFQADINADNDAVLGKVSLGDQQKIWIKPMDGVLIQLGQAYDDTLRGNGTFGSFDWVRIGAGWAGEDLTFARLDTNKGFEVSYTNGDLFLFAAARNLGGATAVSLNDSLLASTQEGLGYTIKDIGQIRVQALGHPEGAFDAYQQVQAAFKLTAVQNLYADVGIDYPTDADAAGYKTAISAYANYTVDKAKLHLLVQYGIPTEGSDSPIQGGLGVDYGLDGGLALSADLRYQNKFAAGNDDGLTNVFVGITKGFSNGLIGIGVQYATILSAFGVSNPDANGGLLLPIRAEYWF